MQYLFNSFFASLSVMKKDKVILLLSLVPVLIGIILYWFVGAWLYGDFYDWGKTYIESNISADGWLSFLTYVFIGILSVVFYFAVSWTFVLVVSIFASPFNDVISSRVERSILGQEPESMGESFSRMMKKVMKIIGNEIKKVALILLLSLLSFVVGFFFPPLSIIISAILLAASFLDYTWSRHEYPFQICLKDMKGAIIPYSLAGFMFMGLMSIPLINILALPLGVIYFTIIHIRVGSLERTPST